MSQLPIIKRGNKRYYFDERLSQLRNVKNPHDFIDLSPEEVLQVKSNVRT